MTIEFFILEYFSDFEALFFYNNNFDNFLILEWMRDLFENNAISTFLYFIL